MQSRACRFEAMRPANYPSRVFKLMNNYKGQPVGIIMANALFEEDQAARNEKRGPSTKKALVAFERLTDSTIPYEQAVAIFDIVFPEYIKIRNRKLKEMSTLEKLTPEQERKAYAFFEREWEAFYMKHCGTRDLPETHIAAMKAGFFGGIEAGAKAIYDAEKIV